MITKNAFSIDGVPLYEDIYMEDLNILIGRKGGVQNSQFIIGNKKTIGYIIKIIKKRQRLELLNNIFDDDLIISEDQKEIFIKKIIKTLHIK